jgi:type I restriction enzyme, R subunit
MLGIIMQTPSFKEDHISQIPALQMLINLGYNYLTPEEALQLRGGKNSNVLFDRILENQLKKINKIRYKGQEYEFSNNNITHAINALKDIPFNAGLVTQNEKIYDQLTLGKSFEENIMGNIKSYTLKYIDWDNIENNVFHVSEEFEVERSDGRSTRRPDLVLFVNGIPLVVIECKRPDIKEPIVEAVSQMIRNQKDGEIQSLFVYSQIVMALSENDAKYATTGTPAKFWAFWKERVLNDDELKKIINTPLTNEAKDKLFSTRYRYVRGYFDELESLGRQITVQDKTIYSLLRKDRLLELTYQYLIYDNNEKKIARYQQYFAVLNTMQRVKEFSDDGVRKGGVIWHTQGSGKSLTMVMLAKALALHPTIESPRIILVTDRINLDEQIYGTFGHCGYTRDDLQQATTGEHLYKLLAKTKTSIITTVIDKFATAVAKKRKAIEANNIFVLVDESHRSQYGIANATMRKLLPKASYIGFTGTPLMKKEKNTALQFGGFIDKYTIDQAVQDGAVVPLLYEGRHALQEVNKKPIDKWFERVSEPLTEYQIVDLKKKYSRADQLNSTDQKIREIAFDISKHFKENWQGTPFKAQLATARKVDAIKYKKYLDEFGMVTSEVLISGPDTREGHDDIYNESKEDVQKFWTATMKRYGSEKDYNQKVQDAFKHTEQPEIIIVVSKLLTGFDAPRNTVLYIAKSLREHELLQAIARVNRLYEGKDYGFIIDYYGVLGELDQALSTYSALEDFDQADVEGTLIAVQEVIKELPQKHADLWDVFKTIKNKLDLEEYQQYLYDEEKRQIFYEKLSKYSRTLGIALSTTSFYDEVEAKQIEKYKEDLRFFQHLRVLVKSRYAESIDYREYEAKIQKLLDQYVTSDEVIKITDQVNIFDRESFEQEVAKVEGKAARADMIAHRTMKTIEDKYEEDPIFYQKFSKLLKKTIEDYRQQRIDEAEYFLKTQQIMDSVRNRKDDGTPSILEGNDIAKAFFGLSDDIISNKNSKIEDIKLVNAEIGLKIDEIFKRNLVVDWHTKDDIQNNILNEIEDYLYELKEVKKLDMSFDDIDKILEKTLEVGKKRYN